MTRTLLAVFLTAIVAFPQARKEFEVASIRVATERPLNAIAVGIQVDGSQVRISYLALKDYISVAYKVRVNQVIGPDWLGSQRFDIAGKLPDGSTKADVPEMLQALLAERFQMKVHREMRELPVYALQVEKTGLKISQTAPPEAVLENAEAMNVAAGATGNGAAISFGDGSSFLLGNRTIEAKRLSMTTVADMMTRFLDRPVVNMTDLKGGYDFVLNVAQEETMPMLIRAAASAGVPLPPQALALLDTASIGSLINSMKKAGLSLEARRAPLEVIVIDSMQKTPSEN
jgi:uncharacterized protein (TIGR03435 family)